MHGLIVRGASDAPQAGKPLTECLVSQGAEGEPTRELRGLLRGLESWAATSWDGLSAYSGLLLQLCYSLGAQEARNSSEPASQWPLCMCWIERGFGCGRGSRVSVASVEPKVRARAAKPSPFPALQHRFLWKRILRRLFSG